MLHTNCHALHFTLPSDAKIQKKRGSYLYQSWTGNVRKVIYADLHRKRTNTRATRKKIPSIVKKHLIF